MKIDFNRPYIIGRELDYIRQAINEYVQLSGDGVFTAKCHAWLRRKLGVAHPLLTHSCTAALEMAALLCDIKPGDEVIMPSYTFSSTANAFALRGAKPIFVDIRPDTLNVDESLIAAAITPRTRAIVPVHYAGVGCEMDTIMELAEQYNLFVVEDAAQGVNAFYRNRALGTIGHLGCFSFHETKNFIAGEGGALAVNNPVFSRRAEIIREKGTNRAEFFRGEVDKYSWVDIGSSYLPSELTAAFLYAQLEKASKITRKRLAIWHYYYDELMPLQSRGVLRLPTVPAHCTHNGHMFYLVVADSAERDNLIGHLQAHDIQAIFHYIPLHASPLARQLGINVELPVTESFSSRLVRLPCFYALQRSQQRYIVDIINDFYS